MEKTTAARAAWKAGLPPLTAYQRSVLYGMLLTDANAQRYRVANRAGDACIRFKQGARQRKPGLRPLRDLRRVDLADGGAAADGRQPLELLL